MILKDADDRAEDIAELKRLKSTSPASFHSAIQKQIDNIFTGLEGERSAAHFINREYSDSERMAVLHDLRIGKDGEFAQIDHLVIHRVQGTAWVLETKNYSGRLNCDEHGDWTTWINSKPISVPSPINQARRHCETLRLWLKANGINSIHTIKPVVLISPTSSINRTKLDRDVHVVKSDNFSEWWNKQSDKLGVGTMLNMLGRHIVTGMSPNELRALGERLVDAHTPTNYDWRAMLRLPLDAAPSTVSAPKKNKSDPEKGITDKQTISTEHGKIQINRLPDGSYTIRNDYNEHLIERVKSACKGTGKWNPKYKNWIVPEAEFPKILELIS